ncbi:penicillin-binding protein [Puia dinghuensis]|uniref:Penicillin-binding protein n=2 Tax=Puia dinghuensis TaxID=1792502 RepID=A0A8J2UDL9_9BACT|nr:penicillin-binding protein [Puia dinghuensis]
MNKYNIPGLSFTIARNDSIKIKRCYGYADKETKELMNPGNCFRIASISKTFTTTAIMKLVEQGKLHLQDKVFGPGAILGTTYGTYPYKRWVEEITVEHLLEHLGGGWADFGNHNMKDQSNDRDPVFLHREMDLDALISWAVGNQPLKHEPGTHFQYSNFGFDLLGRVIEKVTGMKYEEFVRRTVLQPCGITDMQMGGNTLADRLPGEVHYYDSQNDPYTLFDARRLYSNGGWIATPTDLVKFIMRVDKFPQKADILERATLDTMFSPPAFNPDYAKGWFVNKYGDYSHGGGFPGLQSLVVRTHDGFCGSVIVNTRSYKAVFGKKLDELMWQILQAISYWPNGEI